MFNLEKAHLILDEMVLNGWSSLSLSLSLSLSRTPFYSYTNKGCIVETNQSEVLDTMGMLDSETHRGK